MPVRIQGWTWNTQCYQHSWTFHSQTSWTAKRVPFVEFSSAFNTIQPHVLLEKMKAMKANPFIIKWYHSFLTGRSSPIPCLWPQTQVFPTDTWVLHYFTHSTQMIYRWLCNPHPTFAPSNIDTYFPGVNQFTEWCTNIFLELNTQKI